jgi:hypothetical protein
VVVSKNWKLRDPHIYTYHGTYYGLQASVDKCKVTLRWHAASRVLQQGGGGSNPPGGIQSWSAILSLSSFFHPCTAVRRGEALVFECLAAALNHGQGAPVDECNDSLQSRLLLYRLCNREVELRFLPGV